MSWGGAREGSGRRKGSGAHGDITKPMRVPVELLDDVKAFIASKGYKIPLYSSKVQAGFPSPAEDHIEARLDLNEYIIKHPSSTFFVRASGESMINAGIEENDLLVVDRSIAPTEGKIVIAAVEGNLTVKRLRFIKGKAYLYPENSVFKPIEMTDPDAVIWGVVTNVIKNC